MFSSQCYSMGINIMASILKYRQMRGSYMEGCGGKGVHMVLYSSSFDKTGRQWNYLSTNQLLIYVRE